MWQEVPQATFGWHRRNSPNSVKDTHNMNYRLLSKYVAIVMQSQAAFMAIPLAYSVFLRAWPAVEGFAGTIILLVVVSLILRSAGSPERGIIYIKEGFALVAVCWIVVSLFGALPFWISREIPDFIDALFESVSGFTTTGATILGNVEGLSDACCCGGASPTGLAVWGFWCSFWRWCPLSPAPTSAR